jgi:dephospho-CoA kinase
VKRIVIAGGIGAGKSAVRTPHVPRLARRSTRTIIAHESYEPGPAGLSRVARRVRHAVLTDGELDRAFLADVVFHDARTAPPQLHHARTHRHARYSANSTRPTAPASLSRSRSIASEHRENFALDEVWAVEVQPETAFERLSTQRGLQRGRRHGPSGQPDDQRRARAIVDRVIWNEGTFDDLYANSTRPCVSVGLA